jgi:putative cardiolipin synthase
VRLPVLALRLALPLALLSACASLPRDVSRPVSRAWEHPADTLLGRQYLPPPGAPSGAAPLVAGAQAFAARVALAGAAQRTLDLQYYIVRDDATTRLLMARVLGAARRGVRVRLLVDDLDALGRDLDLAALAAAGPAEVRVFNPFATRGRFGFGHLFELIGDNERLNRRMHNKLWIADNAVAVIGGRNLGDEYFEASAGPNFADLDLLVAGAAVSGMSDSFDAYWNSAWAIPVQALLRTPPRAHEIERLERELTSRETRFAASGYAGALRDSGLPAAVRAGRLALEPAIAEVFHDPPSKVDPATDAQRVTPALAPRVQQLLAEARHELVLVTPYLVPTEGGVALLAALVRRGVRVRVLTNSLASAEAVPLAHAGYSRHRPALARAGVELHEMRPTDGEGPQPWWTRARWSGGSLHTKAFVVDRRWVIVGSMNLDPRSRDSNTEVALLLDSPALGLTLGQLFDEAVDPTRAWQVRWVEPTAGVPHLQWAAQDGTLPLHTHHEPEVGLWRRALARLLRAIAPEELL